MSIIIGREHEKNILEQTYHSEEAELIAIYGRRRVGKTYLVKSFFQDKKCIFFQTAGIYKGTLAEQLMRFNAEISTTFYQGAPLKEPKNWMEAFQFLNDAIQKNSKKNNIVFFLDELPWMATPKSGIVRTLEYFWNRYWSSDKRIKMILCGSAASWIIKKIIKNRGGLHNRVTRKIQLESFNLKETELYLKYLNYVCDQQQILKLYMTTGGVPFYLNQLQKNLSVDQNINNLFFKTNGVLFDEFTEVFASLFKNSEHYQEIIRIIASYKDGVSRSLIDEKSKLSGKGGRLTERLEDLEHAGFITSFVPYQHIKRGLFYRINDPYCLFYLKWIDPIKTHLKQNRTVNFWLQNTKKPEYYTWLGHSFENICYMHLGQIRNALGILDNSFGSTWRHISRKGSKDQGTQIDLLFDRDDDAITLCEIKYSETPYSIDKQYAANIANRIEVFKQQTKTKKQILFCLISANGCKENIYYKALINGVVSLEDLFV